jgi:transposase
VTAATPSLETLLVLVTGLQEQVASLRGQAATLQEQTATLQAEVVRLREENDALRAENAALRAENIALRAENDALRAENAALRAENASLREQVRVLTERLDVVERENADLKRRITGRTSERTGRRTTKDPRPKNDAEAQRKRRENREKRKSTCATEDVHHPVDPEVKGCCPACKAGPMRPLSPETSDEFEWVPGRLVRLRHVREHVVCGACGRFEIGAAPVRVVEGGSYGPGFHARVVVHKLLDSVPLYRQVQAFRREGLHVARATLVDLFHRVASLLAPIYAHLLARVPESRVVFADETSLKMRRVEKLGFIWVFATERVVAYVFSPSRSGQTPVRVLGASTGVLVVDGYTGYNEVTLPERRTRAGCNGHARRKFANVDDAGARHILDLYEAIWDVEHDATHQGFAGTAEHLALRRSRAGPPMEAIRTWCETHADEHPPKSAMGAAIRYVRNQYTYLTRFLDDIALKPDNNLSERLLRVIALGRKNYLFVGHEEAGQNSAMLASLIATCVLHDVNPQDYLTDVLLRVQSHPASQVDELLPDRWKAQFASPPA